MMTQIHPTAAVDRGAEIGRNVSIGPFCIVEAGTIVGDDCKLAARVTIKSRTTLGCENQIGEGAVIGGTAQHLQKHEPGGTLTIGNRNRIRENVTIHRGWEHHASTIVKNDNLIMVSSHVGHDCQVGSNCTLVNHVLLGGFVHLNDGVYLGGAVAVVQHCRIGRLAMIGALTKISQDVPPYLTVADSEVVGLNQSGLGLEGFSALEMLQLRAAYRVIYRQGLRWDEVLVALKSDFLTGPAADFHDFLSQGKRGFVQERRLAHKATLKFLNPASDNSDAAVARQPSAPSSSATLHRFR
jgi:UDP-N-acetylglucosamine acyltransferase